MYALIDGLCNAAGIISIVLAAIYQPKYTPLPIAWLLLNPFVLEMSYNIGAKIFGQRVIYDLTPTSRIIYHQSYNLSFCGLEQLHPFDSHKYENVYNKLKNFGIFRSSQPIEPSKVPRSLLLEKMSMWYLIKMCYSAALCSYIEMPLCFLPGFLLRWRVLNPMLLATEGTILACVIALKLKWAINLSGGYHHASFDRGGGFCVYPDISLAVHYLQTRLQIERVMIVDLDAHQGNGHERDHLNREDIYIVDAYNHGIYPHDQQSKRAISTDIKVHYSTSDAEYLQFVRLIERKITEFKPQFLIYNAGTDCLVGDPLGNMSLSEECILKRDEYILQMCLRNHVPMAMLLSGGYQRANASVIADSIQNMCQKFGQ